MELAKEFDWGIVGEAEIGGDDVLVEDRSTKEQIHLLLLNGFARKSQDMAATGEDGAGNLSVERRKKSQSAFFQGEHGVAAAQLDAIVGNDMVEGGRVDAQCVDGIIQFVRGPIGRRENRRRQKTPQREEPHPCPHIQSVVTFGMGEQGGRERAQA